MLYETLYKHRTFDQNVLKTLPEFEQYMKNYETLPGIAAYMSAPGYVKGPCGNPFDKYPF
jgi:hypothetical protein